MQHIVFSVDEISGPGDIENFVSSYPNLHQPPPIPQLELHQCSVSVCYILLIEYNKVTINTVTINRI